MTTPHSAARANLGHVWHLRDEVYEKLEEVVQLAQLADLENVINCAALVKVLVDKGLIEQEEWERAKVAVRAAVDQEIETQRDV